MKFYGNVYNIIYCLNRLSLLGSAYLILNSGVQVATGTVDTVLWSVGIHQSRSEVINLKSQNELTAQDKSQLMELNNLIEGLQNDNWINRMTVFRNLPLFIIGLMGFSYIMKDIKKGY
jgi:hypothetical protein